jgi:hypothetical protein
MRRERVLGTWQEPIMVPRDRNQVENIITMILLGLVVCSAVLLAIFLFLSPSLH